ncbi:MAG TPA: hypothetical protein VE641_04830 [Chthoniobacterales bacterium]|nr:hypothetical protein [Chthoniobacterales bacterium]
MKEASLESRAFAATKEKRRTRLDSYSKEMWGKVNLGSFNFPAREVQLRIGPTKDGHELRTANCER